jgi:1-acyl-sn-glycerol-3-phosphate acyltransferase
VIFFPEATSSPGETVLPFHSSLFEVAARSRVPVVAASLQYETHEPAPIAGWSVCWWGRMPFASHVFALLGLPRVVVRIRFSEPIEPLEDRKKLCRLARDRVVKQFIPSAPIGFCAALPTAERPRSMR